MDPTYSIRTLDLHYVFGGVESVALIVIVLILASSLISRPGFIKSSYKSLSWLFVILLVLGIAGVYVTDLYGYLHNTRPGYQQINQEVKHQRTGL